MKAIVVSAVAVLGAVGCKDKDKDKQQDEPAKVVEPAGTGSAPPAPAPTPPPPPPTTPPAAAGPAIPLQSGESFDGADLNLAGTNPMAWTPSGGEPVSLGVVFKKESAYLVAATASGPTQLAMFDFNPAYSVNLALQQNPDGTALVVFQSTGGSGDPGFLSAWQVAWDAKAKKPAIKQKGNWSGDKLDKVPAWAKPPP